MRANRFGIRAAVALGAFALGCTTTNPDLKNGLTQDDAGGGRDARRPGPVTDADQPPVGGAASADALPVGGSDPRDASAGGVDPSDAQPNAGGALADTDVTECTPGTPSREDCGRNGRGQRERACDDSGRFGPWSDCVDPDVCDDGTAETQACGVRGRGEQQRVCNNGQWSGWAPCDDPDQECADGTSEVAACGLNGRGTQTHTCVNGRYGMWSDCVDPDVCIDAATDTGVCGLNRRGQRVRTCTEGQWSPFSACQDPDICVEGTQESRDCPAGGTQSRACVQGQWSDFSACPAAPCDSIVAVGVGVTASETFATDALTSSCNGSDRGERALSFTAPAVGTYTFRLSEGSRTASLSIRNECARQASELTCIPPDSERVVQQVMAAGQTLYLIVESTNNAQPFSLEVTAQNLVGPCATPQLAVVGENRAQAMGASGLASTCQGAGPEKVFLFTPPQSGLWSFDPADSNFDTVVSVRTTCDAAASELACIDDVGNERQAELVVPLVAGTLYAVIVDGFGAGDAGSIVLTVSRAEPLPSDVSTVQVPAGRFLRGSSSDNAPNNERPQQEVRVSEYEIDVDEVTVDEFDACVAAGRCAEPDFGDVEGCNWENRRDLGGHPMNCLTWFEAANYCAQVGKRLPTEAEWEKAARGGCERRGAAACEAAVDAPPYAWGAAPPPDCDRAQKRSCDEGRTAEVPATHPDGNSPYGVHDMAGNVSEWVADCYAADFYTTGGLADPFNAGPVCDQAVRRGGQSTEDSWQSFRVARRVPTEPNDRAAGVRCVQ